MNFKIEVGVNVTQEGYKMLKYFSKNNEVPADFDCDKLEDLKQIGLVSRGDDPFFFRLTLLGEHLLSLIDSRLSDAKEFVDFFNQLKEGEDENA